MLYPSPPALARHCEERSDEAIQLRNMDCFAPLAMTTATVERGRSGNLARRTASNLKKEREVRVEFLERESEIEAVAAEPFSPAERPHRPSRFEVERAVRTLIAA